MGDPSVGIVLPVYRPHMDILLSFIEDVVETVQPDVCVLEWDDPSPEQVRRVQKTGVTINTAERRRGKGAAISAGFNRLDTDILLFADSDGSVRAASLNSVIDPIRNGYADMVTGSRRHPEATIVSHESVLRRILGDVFAGLARAMISPTLYDYQCGAKAVRHDIWCQLRDRITTTGFAWDLELLGLGEAIDARIQEVAVTWEDQPHSTVSTLPAATQLLWVLVQIFYRQHLPLH